MASRLEHRLDSIKVNRIVNGTGNHIPSQIPNKRGDLIATRIAIFLFECNCGLRGKVSLKEMASSERTLKYIPEYEEEWPAAK